MATVKVDALKVGDVVTAHYRADMLESERGEVLSLHHGGVTVLWSGGEREFYHQTDTWVSFEVSRVSHHCAECGEELPREWPCPEHPSAGVDSILS